MEITAQDQVELNDAEVFDVQYLRFKVDGIGNGASINSQFVTTLATFTSKELNEVVQVDEIYVGVNGKEQSLPPMALELNCYDPPPTPSNLGDNQNPTYPQSLPITFNAQAQGGPGTASAAVLPQKIKGFARVNQLLQVCLRVASGQSVTVPPMTVQFRKTVFRKR